MTQGTPSQPHNTIDEKDQSQTLNGINADIQENTTPIIQQPTTTNNENTTDNILEEEKNEISETVKEYMKTINLENFDDTMDRVRSLKKDNKMDCCFDLLEAMIQKGLELFNDPYHIKLATPYFKLGDLLLMKLEDENDLFGGNDNNKPGSEQMTEREIEIEAAFQNLEIARVLLTKYLEKEGVEKTEAEVINYKLMLADVFKRLSEHEMLKENFGFALSELEKGIEILEEVENKEESRILSEFYFLKSCILGYFGEHQNLEKSKEFSKKAKIIIENYTDKYKDQQEEMKILLKTIKTKILDLEEEIKETKKQNISKIKESIQQSGVQTTNAFPESQFKNNSAKKINLGNFGKNIPDSNSNSNLKEKSKNLLLAPKSNELNNKMLSEGKTLQKVQMETNSENKKNK